MPQTYSLKEIKAAIKSTAEKLFSDGTLSDQTNWSHTLSTMQGLDLFATAVPWRIELSGTNSIDGFSETLQTAAKDIHAQLLTLGKVLPHTFPVTIAINEAQLPVLRPINPPFEKIGRG